MPTKAKTPYGEVIKALREKLELSQEQFSGTYNIPIKTLQSWEQDTRNPDSAAASYLIMIARHPRLVRDTLAQVKKSPAR